MLYASELGKAPASWCVCVLPSLGSTAILPALPDDRAPLEPTLYCCRYDSSCACFCACLVVATWRSGVSQPLDLSQRLPCSRCASRDARRREGDQRAIQAPAACSRWRGGV